jgi:O-Antigen ligase
MILGRYGVTAGVAAGVVALAHDNGSFGVIQRNSAAILVWWAIALVLGLGLWRISRPSRPALIAGAALGALTLLTFVSAAWAPSVETVLREGGRNALYLGVFTLVAAGANRRDPGRWCDGIALGIVSVFLLGLGGRLFPGTGGPNDSVALLGRASLRLSYPLGYWNALGILGALSVPLLTRLSIASRSATGRALALAPVPAVIAGVYLTSSRTAIVALAVGSVSFFCLSAPRWPVIWRTAVWTIGSAAAIIVLLLHPVVSDGPLGTNRAAEAGLRVALLLGAICALTAGAAAGFERVRVPASLSSRTADRRFLALAAALALVAVIAANPVERFETFKEPPAIDASDPNYIQGHLTSTSGNARWEYWAVAVDEFRANPFSGGGAGSFGSWWEERRPVYVISRDAHSLYVETLGELGVPGLLCLVVLVACGAIGGTRRALASSGRGRTTAAAATSSSLAFAVAAGLDWAWEVPALGAVGVALLALATTEPGPMPVGSAAPRSTGLVRACAVAVFAAVAIAAAIPILSENELRRSRSAAARGDRVSALDAADMARRIEPWNASAYVQLALLHEEAGEYERARRAIEQALARDGRDWTLWVVAMRIQNELGDASAARTSLERARRLNPFSAQSVTQ